MNSYTGKSGKISTLDGAELAALYHEAAGLRNGDRRQGSENILREIK